MKHLVVLLLSLLLAGISAAQSESWRVERLGETESRLIGPGGNRVRLVGLTPEAEVELAPSITGAVGVLIRHRKFTDLLVYRLAADGLEEIKLPELPGGEILKKYPTGGKPAELQRPRLEAMSIEKVGWAEGGRLAARIDLWLVDEVSGDTSWAYTVDAAWSLPPANSPKGTPAVLTVLNIHLAKKAR